MPKFELYTPNLITNVHIIISHTNNRITNVQAKPIAMNMPSYEKNEIHAPSRLPIAKGQTISQSFLDIGGGWVARCGDETSALFISVEGFA